MRKDRQAEPLNEAPHALALAVPGVNRHTPGTYICTCGETFTGINKYEGHRADKRKENRFHTNSLAS